MRAQYKGWTGKDQSPGWNRFIYTLKYREELKWG